MVSENKYHSEPLTASALDALCTDMLRLLAVDAVPRVPRLADGFNGMAYTLWNRFLKFNSRDPHGLTGIGSCAQPGNGLMMLFRGQPCV